MTTYVKPARGESIKTLPIVPVFLHASSDLAAKVKQIMKEAVGGACDFRYDVWWSNPQQLWAYSNHESGALWEAIPEKIKQEGFFGPPKIVFIHPAMAYEACKKFGGMSETEAVREMQSFILTAGYAARSIDAKFYAVGDREFFNGEDGVLREAIDESLQKCLGLNAPAIGNFYFDLRKRDSAQAADLRRLLGKEVPLLLVDILSVN